MGEAHRHRHRIGPHVRLPPTSSGSTCRIGHDAPDVAAALGAPPPGI